MKKYSDEDKEEPSPLTRKKSSQNRLTFDQKVDATWMVLMKKETQAMTARHFRVSVQVITRLMCKLRDNPNLLAELLSQRESR